MFLRTTIKVAAASGSISTTRFGYTLFSTSSRKALQQVPPTFGRVGEKKGHINSTLKKIGEGKVVRVPKKVRLGKGLSARIVFEDKNLLIVNKPAGVLTQGDVTGDLDLVTGCIAYLQEQQDIEELGDDFIDPTKGGEAPYLGVVQRLDRPVSGLVLFGKTKIATQRMAKQFQDRQVIKDYMAIVEGEVHGTGTVEGGTSFATHWSGKGWKKTNYAPNESKFDGERNPKSLDGNLHWAAQSQISVLKGKEATDMTVVSVRPETGRKHQIRRQLAKLGHPIIGDTLYKSQVPTNDGTILLHAYQLEFTYPMMRRPGEPKTAKPKKRRMRVVSLTPDEWKTHIGNAQVPQVARGEKLYTNYSLPVTPQSSQ